MRILIKGDMPQVIEAVTTLARAVTGKPQRRQDTQWQKQAAEQFKNRSESDLIRRAFHAVRYEQPETAAILARALNGKIDRTPMLMLQVQSILDGGHR